MNAPHRRLSAFIACLVFILLLTACAPATIKPTTQIPAPLAAASPTPAAGPTRPTAPATTPPLADTPAAPASTPTSPRSDLSAILQAFPLFPGSRWTYTYTGYEQAPGDPNALIHATVKIVRNVTGATRQGDDYLAQVQEEKTLVSADPDWQDTSGLGLGKSTVWYLIHGGSVYTSSARPDLAALQTGQLTEELHFPLSPGESWCPNKQEKGSTSELAQTPSPCEFAGMRTVQKEDVYQASFGLLTRCFQMTDQYNSGGVIRWFCPGYGLAGMKYDHAGSRFGFEQQLIEFVRGTLPDWLDTAIPESTVSAGPVLPSLPSPTPQPTFSPDPAFPPDRYPAPLPFANPVNGISMSGCPDLSSVSSVGSFPAGEAVQLLDGLRSGDVGKARSSSDQTYWYFLSATAAQPPLPPESVQAQPAVQSPYAGLIKTGCGQATLDRSWWVQVCSGSCADPRRSLALDAHYFVINREGRWLVWASYP